MWTIGEIKSKGKDAFKSNYWRSVLVALLLSLVTAAQASSSNDNSSGDDIITLFNGLSTTEQYVLGGFIGVGLIISILITLFLKNPLQVGCYRFFKKNVNDPSVDLGTLKDGFGGYGRVFITLFLKDLFLVLWTLLLIVPGIIKVYSYRMVPFIVKDNPELSATEVITRSRQMMNGNKFKAFLFDLSFIGWFLLSALTFGILFIFWTDPYYQNANAALYLELSKEFDSVVE